MYRFACSWPGCTLANQVILVVLGYQVASEKSIVDLATANLLFWRGFLVAQVSQRHGDGIRRLVVNLGLVNYKGLGQDAALHLDGAFRVFLDVVEEETLDAALVEDDLLKARESRRGVRYAIRPADHTIGARVLDRGHGQPGVLCRT